MQIYLGAQYVDDFNKFGRTYQVIAQADAPVSLQARHDILQLQTRNADGQMVPFGAIMKVSETTGPDGTAAITVSAPPISTDSTAPGFIPPAKRTGCDHPSF